MSKKSRQAGANRRRREAAVRLKTSGDLALSRRSGEVRSGSFHDRGTETKERLADSVSVGVIEGARGPLDMSLSGRPYAEERSPIWGGKAPPVDIEWHRRVYDMNKELANDLRIGCGVKAGRPFLN